ncbi:MAG: preprotein translocase subunit SecE [Holosporales bacterium]|jgi:preprotein translocase subunit SecE|nr:preprotein translocase subunit SecE [Holosporales bacterium]
MKSKSAVSRFFTFVKDVRQEIDKVMWPSRQEVTLTSIVVVVMAIVAALFFSLVDTASYKLVHSIIGR